MNVPITSDLHGYAAFWDAWLWRLAIGGLVFGLTVIGLLIGIWRRLGP